MKKSLFAISFCLAATALHAQSWKLLPVFTDDMTATYLSFCSPDGDAADGSGEVFFSLWGQKSYDSDSYSPFEVEYFRGTPRQTFEFLRGVRDFARKYRSETALADISGVKVKSFQHPLTGIYTAVYDASGRDFCMYKARRWESLFDDFEAFCKANGIEPGE